MRKLKSDLLGLIMPTIDQYSLKNYWLPSVENLKDIAPFCNICINFQKYPTDLIDYVVNKLNSYGFVVYFTAIKEYTMEKPGMLQFNKIRNDTVMLNPNSAFYCLTDDDFSYLGPSSKSPSAGEQYLRVLHYMLTYDNCGCVLTGGSLYRYNPINTIGPTKSFNGEWFITGKSLFLKSMSEHGYELFPDDSLELYGAKEECLLCASRINLGYYPAKFGNARVKHDENRRNGVIKPGDEEFGWLKEEIVENNVNKYIRDHYNVNMHGICSYNVCNDDTYYSNGGINHDTEHEKYTIDYSKYSKDQLIDEIYHMWREKYFDK